MDTGASSGSAEEAGGRRRPTSSSASSGAASAKDVSADMVRAYLVEIGQIPLFSREEELAVTSALESRRRTLRRLMLTNDYMLHHAVMLLRQARDGQLRFDRVVDVPVTQHDLKSRIRQHLDANLRTLTRLLQANREEFRAMIESTRSVRQRRQLRRRLTRRRDRAVRLVEELNLRLERIIPLHKQLSSKCRRMLLIRRQLAQCQDEGERATARRLRRQLKSLVLATGATPRSLVREMAKTQRVRRQYHKARKDVCVRNLRLVVSIAKCYRNRGVGLLDLIQEGNQGLMRAIDKYECSRGNKFSTYATWWIRQAVQRSVASHGRTIRTPDYVKEKILRIDQAAQEIQHHRARRPYVSEIAHAAGMSVDDVRCLDRVTRPFYSLDQPVHENLDHSLGDLVGDYRSQDPLHDPKHQELSARLAEAMGILSSRERELMGLRFGLADGKPRTLKEVGDAMGVTRERVRQIEARALQKLRRPEHCGGLLGFLDGIAR